MNRQKVFCPPVPHPTLFVCIISWTCISNFVLEVDITLAMEKQAILSVCLRIGSHLILFVFFVQIYLMEELRDYRYPSICTILDLYEFDLYELFLLTKTFDLYECHSICTSFSLFLGRFFWQFGKILTFEGKMLLKIEMIEINF